MEENFIKILKKNEEDIWNAVDSQINSFFKYLEPFRQATLQLSHEKIKEKYAEIFQEYVATITIENKLNVELNSQKTKELEVQRRIDEIIDLNRNFFSEEEQLKIKLSIDTLDKVAEKIRKKNY